VPDSENWQKFAGHLEEIRVQAQDLQARALDPILEAAKLKDEKARESELGATVADSIDLFKDKDFGGVLRELRALLKADPEVASSGTDTVVSIENSLDAAKRDWPETKSIDNAEMQARDAKGALDDIVLDCGLVTIPTRLNEHLKTVRVGQALDFKANFKDELPAKSQRKEVLDYLAEHPTAVWGLVDPEKELVYRMSMSIYYRLFTYISPLLMTAAIGAALVGLAQFDNWGLVSKSGEWQYLSSGRALVSTYVFVLAGAVTHLLVESLKQVRFGQGAPIYAVSSWLDWLHLRWVSISLSFFPVVVTVLGLRLTHHTGWPTAFFAGYGIDSVAGLFLTRFDAAATKGVNILGKALKS
jgi:hypothetical protein